MSKRYRTENLVENSNFHFIETTGETSFELGFSHGKQLKNSILENFNFYRKAFNREEIVLESISNFFANKIKDFDGEIYEEIRGIASGAGMPAWQVFMLNARSEIFSNINLENGTKNTHECTLVFFPEKAILSENWDFANGVSKGTYLLSINKKGMPKILTLTEAGIVSKIGLNEYGIGVGMNFLDPEIKLTGIPIHVQIRKALEQVSFLDAVNIFKTNGQGVSGNICVVSGNGNYLDIELDGKEIFESKNDTNKKYYCHANHFISPGTENKSQDADSLSRQAQIDKKMEEISDIEYNLAQSILADQTDSTYPLLVEPKLDEFFPNLGKVGTNTFVMLLLKEREIRVAYEFEDFKNLHTKKIY